MNGENQFKELRWSSFLNGGVGETKAAAEKKNGTKASASRKSRRPIKKWLRASRGTQMKPTFTIGIEEEYMTIDPESRDLRSHIQTEILSKGKISY